MCRHSDVGSSTGVHTGRQILWGERRREGGGERGRGEGRGEERGGEERGWVNICRLPFCTLHDSIHSRRHELKGYN